MGRRRTINLKLPPHLHQKGGSFYFVQMVNGMRKWIPLGNDMAAARVKWAELTNLADTEIMEATFLDAANRFRREVLPTKSAKTQEEYARQLLKLTNVFGRTPLHLITPLHIRQYMETRSAKVAANREKALFSTVFNHARMWGYTSAANPCAGVRSHREEGRIRYVDDQELLAVMGKACQPLRDALELAYYTGQRPADVLNLRRTDIRDGALWIRQRKTHTALRIDITGPLSEVLTRIAVVHALPTPSRARSLYLVQNEAGEPLGKSALRYRFSKACKLAGIPDFQFRDIRAKAATDTEDISGLGHSQRLLGHSSRKMTEHYVKDRAGYRVAPNPHTLTKRRGAK